MSADVWILGLQASGGGGGVRDGGAGTFPSSLQKYDQFPAQVAICLKGT